MGERPEGTGPQWRNRLEGCFKVPGTSRLACATPEEWPADEVKGDLWVTSPREASPQWVALSKWSGYPKTGPGFRS